MAHYMHIRDTKNIKNVTLNLFQGLKNVAANFSLRFISQAKACGYTIIIFLFLLFTVHYSLLTVSYAETPNRIISLARSVTEILFAAGFGDRVVGVTNFCDYPPEAKQKPKIGGMSNPSLEAVVSLKPDIVVLTTDGNPEEFEHKLHSMKIKTHVFEAVTLPELADGIRKMGIALDAKESFNSLASGRGAVAS
ncbi:MAG: helical backbone metal receptor [Thermodesulfovibrionia bacterium]|nr:helical backbone metal receptor [Thermodesulfovibrionia bacterium]